MSRLHQDKVNCHMCHMRMSLKAQTHFKTIRNFWVITPRDARQKLGMLIFVHEKISTPPPAHLNPLPCLLSCMNWLLHPRLIFTNPQHAYMPTPPQDMPPWPPPHLCPHHSLCFHTPAS
ncbi:hypothetical protein O181_119403 [Austropuccinia psidii MF-1]|uniref:Uncharacterized protein n=1 Tax=Austropuccinia psidii MF-1 TaxID=1389203 RepID=A0A9Q3KDT7_9BASI|nr:hypothetical protein [Austropuccinia psidii MF-1]